MSKKLSIIDPVSYPRWNEMILSCPDYSFFHTRNWSRVLVDSYHYKPMYFTLFQEKKISFSFPIMEVKSYLTGDRAVSLPFTDYCQPLVSGDIQHDDVFDQVCGYGERAGWKYVEIRGGAALLDRAPYSSYYYRHMLELSANKGDIYSKLRDSTRRNIKKSMREGVTVEISNSYKSIVDFYRLNCLTRKMHGLPPQPYFFFKSIHEHIISQNYGFVILASYGGEPIAGSIYFHVGRRAVYKYGASDRRYQHLRANNLVMWEAIKYYHDNDYESICLGRTEPENSGLRQFKNGWGVQEDVIKYFRYDLNKNSFVSGGAQVSGFHNRIFHMMPVALLRVVGSLLYRHVG